MDEVLAVGDAQFQQKCLGKMNQVARAGRTVLFVSHNLATINTLCPTGLWLREGRVKQHGPAGDVIAAYLADGKGAGHEALSFRREARPDARHHILAATARSEGDDDYLRSDRGIVLSIETNAPLPADLTLGLKITNQHGTVVLNSTTELADRRASRPAHPNPVVVHLPPHALRGGRHLVTLFIGKRGYEAIDRLEDVLALNLQESLGVNGIDTTPWPGVLNPNCARWE